MFSFTRAWTVKAILRDLKSQNWAARIAAAEQAERVVAHFEESRDEIVGALMRGLEDSSPVSVRMACIHALADLRAHEALSVLLVLIHDDDRTLAQCAIHALGEIGDVRAYEPIRRKLSDIYPAVRFQAIVAFVRLARIHNAVEEAWAALHSMLEDEDSEVRSRTADTISEFAQGQPLPRAIADRLVQLSDSTRELIVVRSSAALALAESHDSRAGSTLLSILQGKLKGIEPGKEQAAFELAGELALEGARELAAKAAFGLRSRLGEPSRRLGALVALVHLQDPRAIQFVLKNLSSRSFTQRTFALGIVGRAPCFEAKALLESLRKKPHLADPQAVEDALVRIELNNPRGEKDQLNS